MSDLSHSAEYFSAFQGDTGPIGPQGPRGLRGQPVSFLSCQAISGGTLCIVGMSCRPELCFGRRVLSKIRVMFD